MKHKYGNFSREQILLTKKDIRKQIFFLLLCADPETRQEYKNVNVAEAIENLLYKLDGLNSLLYEPKEIVDIMSLLEEALIISKSPTFDFKLYRKLILDAGSLTLKIKEVD